MKLFYSSIIGIIIIFLGGCKMPKGFTQFNGVIPQSNISKNCQEVLSAIRSNWMISRVDKCYYLDGKSIKLLQGHENCFSGWTYKEVTALFGEPNLKSKVISYNIVKECDSKLSSREYTIYFYYDNESTNVYNRIISGHSVEKIFLSN